MQKDLLGRQQAGTTAALQLRFEQQKKTQNRELSQRLLCKILRSDFQLKKSHSSSSVEDAGVAAVARALMTSLSALAQMARASQPC
jgi:hypothetical protein